MALPRRGDSLSNGAWTAPTVGTCTGSRVTGWKGGDRLEMGDIFWDRCNACQEDVTHCKWGDTFHDRDVTHWEGGDTSQGGGDTEAVEGVTHAKNR